MRAWSSTGFPCWNNMDFFALKTTAQFQVSRSVQRIKLVSLPPILEFLCLHRVWPTSPATCWHCSSFLKKEFLFSLLDVCRSVYLNYVVCNVTGNRTQLLLFCIVLFLLFSILNDFFLLPIVVHIFLEFSLCPMCIFSNATEQLVLTLSPWR